MTLQFQKLPRKSAQALGIVIAILIVLLQIQCFSAQKSPFPFEEFKKYENNPILSPGDGFESHGVFNPTVIMVNDTIYMFYRAQDEHGTSSIGLAKSVDGIHFERNSEPLIVPEYDYELPGGCEDPRIVKVTDTYYLTYTAYDGDTARLALATSKDLVQWEKHGPILPSFGWTKAGAILPEKIDGRYVMYFGDSNMWIAWSTDLIHWEVIDEPVLRPRKGYFDGGIVEPGPPPMLTEDGILLIYNGNISWERAIRGTFSDGHREF
jgi:predicted GH43/DUF377 family glycosyl hydrolase